MPAYQQRLSLSSPATTGSDGVETPASSRLSWWRGSGSKASSDSEHASNRGERQSRLARRRAKLPGDVWPESRSEWLARHFPLLSRGWNGNAGEQHARRRRPERSNAREPSLGALGSGPRPLDRACRRRCSAGPGIFGRRSAPAAKSPFGDRVRRNERPRLPTLLAGTGRPHSLPESSGDVELDVSSSGSRGDDQLSSGETDPAPADARQPAEDSPVPSPSDREAPGPLSAADQPGWCVGAVPVAGRGRPGGTHGDGRWQWFRTGAGARYRRRMPRSDSRQPRILLRSWNQLRPRFHRHPSRRRNALRLLHRSPDGARPADRAHRAAGAGRFRGERGEAPAVPSSRSAFYRGPRARLRRKARSQRRPLARDFSRRPPSPIYASPPPVAPPEPRGKFLSWLHPDGKAEPLASPQLPPATFPTTYRLNPAPAMPVQATPQKDAVPCATPANAAKKPCVLTGLFHKLKSWGHGSGCGGCQRDGSPSCCHGCTCCAGRSSTVSGSPQGPAHRCRGRRQRRRGRRHRCGGPWHRSSAGPFKRDRTGRCRAGREGLRFRRVSESRRIAARPARGARRPRRAGR